MLFNMKITPALTLFLLFFPNAASAGWMDKIFGYDSFEDCLLGELKGSETKSVASLKTKACRDKFPEAPGEKVEAIFRRTVTINGTTPHGNTAISTLKIDFMNEKGFNIEGVLEVVIAETALNLKCSDALKHGNRYRQPFSTSHGYNYVLMNIQHTNKDIQLCTGSVSVKGKKRP